MAYVNLPFDFEEIIQYDNLKSVDCRLLGYNYNTKDNNFQITISTIDKKINDVDVYERIAGALKTAENNEKDIQEIKQKINKIENKINNPNKIEEINTKDTSIIAGASNTVKINESGLSTHEVNNEDRRLIFNAGALGISQSGNNDFEPIITADGINPKFISNSISVEVNGNKNNSDTSENQHNDQKPPTIIKNPPIRYMDLTCKLIRNDKNQVERIDYYNQQGSIEYIEKIIRDDLGKVIKVEKDHIDKEKQITTIVRDDKTNKVTDVAVEYENDNEIYEFGGML